MQKHRKCENIESEKILTLPADLKNPGKEKMTKSPRSKGCNPVTPIWTYVIVHWKYLRLLELKITVIIILTLNQILTGENKT
jgi:hypothetical protein